MASSVIGNLRVNLGLDSAQFQTGLRGAQATLASARLQFVAFAAAATAALTGVFVAARAGAQDIDATVKAARRLGASLGGYEAVRMVADEAGVSVDSLADNLQNLDRVLSTVGEGGAGADALRSLSLSAADLVGMDVDEKIATIADRIGELGLDTGTTTQLLRDLGIRNREMVLLMMAGGDAIRAARQDVQDYGLALSSVQTDAIERANDQIGRLGVIGRYVGQQLALQLIPPLGAMAQALTDSLRPGGALRIVIDGLVQNLQRLATYAGTFAAFLGARYVAALVAARVATMSLAGALLALRGALIRTGIGALIVAAGEMVYQFSRLVRAAGGFGNALGLLKDVAVEVFGRIRDAFGLVPLAIRAGAAAMTTFFLGALRSMLQGFQDLTWAVAEGLNSLFGTNLRGATIGAISDGPLFGAPLDVAVRDAGKAALNATNQVNDLAASLTAPLESVQAIRDLIAGMGDEAEGAAGAVSDLGDELGEVGGEGGGSGGAAAAGIAETNDALEEMRQRSESAADTVAGLFGSVLDGSKSAKEAIGDLLKQIAQAQLTEAFRGLAGSGGGFFGWLGGLLGYADGTRNFPGGFARINERGGEIVRLPSGSQVIPHDISKRMSDRAAVSEMARVEIVPSPYFDARVDGRAARVTGAGMQMQSRQTRNTFMSQSERYG